MVGDGRFEDLKGITAMTEPTKKDEPPRKPMPDAEADKVEDMATTVPVKQMDNMGAAIDAAEKGKSKDEK